MKYCCDGVASRIKDALFTRFSKLYMLIVTAIQKKSPERYQRVDCMKMHCDCVEFTEK